MTAPAHLSPRLLMRAHQYLYYVLRQPVISDFAYDTFCRDAGLDGGGGSDRACDYTEDAMVARGELTCDSLGRYGLPEWNTPNAEVSDAKRSL